MKEIEFNNFNYDDFADEIINYIEKKKVKTVVVKTSVKVGRIPDVGYEERIFMKSNFDSLRELIIEYLDSSLDRYLELQIPEINTRFNIDLGSDVSGQSDQEDFEKSFGKFR